MAPISLATLLFRPEHGGHRDKCIVFYVISWAPHSLSSWESTLLLRLQAKPSGDGKQDFRRQRQVQEAPHSPTDPAQLQSAADLEAMKINIVIIIL